MAAALDAVGAGYTRNVRGLPGTPDFVMAGGRLAVFVHGCYWHSCPKHRRRLPKTNRAFWRAKFDANRRRDARARRALNRAGWRTAVVWEHEDPARAARRVANRLAKVSTTTD